MNMDKERSNITHIVKHAGFNTVGTFFHTVLQFTASVIITRTIGAELFGKYSLAHGIFEVMGVFAVFGLNTGVVRFSSKYRAQGEQPAVKGTLMSGIWLTLTISVALTAAVIIAAPGLASRVFSNVEGIDWVLRVHMLALPFFALMFVIVGYTQGLKTLKYTVIVQLITRPSVRLIAVVLFFLLGLRLAGVLYATVLSFVAAAALAYVFARRVSPFDFRGTPARLVTWELLAYSLPLVSARLMTVVISRSNTILVGYFKDSVSTGLFGAAATLAPYISLSLISFSRILAPFISELWESGQVDELKENLKTSTKWIFGLGLPVFIAYELYAPHLLSVFGSDFAPAANALRILAIGQLVNAMVGSVGHVLVMTGRQKLNMYNAIALAILSVGLGVILIPRYGIAGAALGTTIPLVAINLVRVFQVKLLYGFTPFRRDFLKPILAAAATAAGFYVLNLIFPVTGVAHALAASGALLAAYAVLLYLLGLKEEKEILLEILRRRR
jgi:O-antigen/teichoic acid export membrane protein